MAQQAYKDGRWCPSCEREVAGSRKRAGHVLHGTLTAVTLGGWSPIYGAVAAGRSAQNPRCPICSSKTIATDTASETEAERLLADLKNAPANKLWVQAKKDYKKAREQREAPRQTTEDPASATSVAPPGWGA